MTLAKHGSPMIGAEQILITGAPAGHTGGRRVHATAR